METTTKIKIEKKECSAIEQQEEKIKSRFQEIGNKEIKIKHIVYFISGVLGLALLVFIGAAIVQLLVIIWEIWASVFEIATGMTYLYHDYTFFDQDLVCTLTVSLVTAFLVARFSNTTLKNRFWIGVAYFVFLAGSLELWSYIYAITYLDGFYGGAFWAIFVVAIPALVITQFLWLKFKKKGEEKEEVDLPSEII